MTHVPMSMRRKSYAYTDGKCVICGKLLPPDPDEWSVDHFVPQAIRKWIPGRRIRDLVDRQDNLFVVHPKCNFSKGSDLPTNAMISGMHASAKVKRGMRRLRQAAQKDIDAYRRLKRDVLRKQGYRCPGCGRHIDLSTATMRRIDDTSARTKRNAMCLCERCNRYATNADRKRLLAKKLRRLAKRQRVRNPHGTRRPHKAGTTSHR